MVLSLPFSLPDATPIGDRYAMDRAGEHARPAKPPPRSTSWRITGRRMDGRIGRDSRVCRLGWWRWMQRC